MRIVLCIVLLFPAACGTKELGRRLSLADASPLKLGISTVTSEVIQSPHTYTGLSTGRMATVHLGNTGAQAVSVTLSGAETTELVLPPGQWTALRTRLTAETLALTWPGQPLRSGSLYLHGNQEQTQPNVLLVSIDTLRADYFTAEYMPRTYKALAKGRFFSRAYTPTPWTLPAHVSMLSGQYPAKHGVRLPDQRIPEQVITLPELFQEAGYTTLAMTEGNYVSGTFGFTQGFDLFMENAPSMLERDPHSISKLEANLASLADGMARHQGTSQFVFLHTYEVHCPYLPRGDVQDDAGRGHTQWLLDNDGKPLSPETYTALKDLYQGEVAWLDQQLAPLLAEKIAAGWVVAVTSDHGEEFGEHGGLLHADTLYEETTHIPLVLAGPGIQAGTDALPVSLVDLPGTLALLAGLTPPESWQSRNLLDTNRPNSGVFAESFFFGPHIPTEDPRIAAIWMAHDKLIQTRNFQQIQAELFALAEDPAENNNLQAKEKQRRDSLYLLLSGYLSGKSLDAIQIEGLSPEQIETMRSLGYID